MVMAGSIYLLSFFLLSNVLLTGLSPPRMWK